MAKDRESKTAIQRSGNDETRIAPGCDIRDLLSGVGCQRDGFTVPLTAVSGIEYKSRNPVVWVSEVVVS